MSATLPPPAAPKPQLNPEALGLGKDEAAFINDLQTAQVELEERHGTRYEISSSPPVQGVWHGNFENEAWSWPDPEPDPSNVKDAFASWKRTLISSKADGSIYDSNGKVSQQVMERLGAAGFWGQLVPKEYNGLGRPFRSFARDLTNLAALNGTIAGLASVHQCIGAVNPLVHFGTPEQKQKWLPRLASGELLSGFALTEPGAGSDLRAIKTTAKLDGDDYVINGQKLFITNVTYGRLVSLVCQVDGKLRVLMVELPQQDNETFQLQKYKLCALTHALNHGLIFKGFRVPKENLLPGKGLTIAYNGLNLGRVVVCAGAAGALRKMLVNMPKWANYRQTLGAPIAHRELVKERIAEMAGLLVGCDAMTNWCAHLLDSGYRGEIECMIAKIFGSESAKHAAIELFMKSHGGRSFIHGHFFADTLGDFLAPTIYEGEGDMLSMAIFAKLVEGHGLKYFQPIAEREQKLGVKFNEKNPWRLWQFRTEAKPYAKWLFGLERGSIRDAASIGLRHNEAMMGYVAYAQKGLFKMARELSALMRRYKLKLGDRQCTVRDASKRFQKLVVMHCTAIHAGLHGNATQVQAAHLLCMKLREELEGKGKSAEYYRNCNKFAELIQGKDPTHLKELVGDLEPDELLMQY